MQLCAVKTQAMLLLPTQAVLLFPPLLPLVFDHERMHLCGVQNIHRSCIQSFLLLPASLVLTNCMHACSSSFLAWAVS
jgi:hypothetical protein